MPAMVDCQDFANGRITIFHDPSVKTTRWQCRLRVPGKPGYVFKGTGTTDFEEAKVFAEQLFAELSHRANQGLSIKEWRFQDVHKEFLEVIKETLSIHRQALHTGFAKRYFIPFFGKMDINAINENQIEKYFDWRMAYWATGPGSKGPIPGNVALVPARKTMDMEKGCLNQIFKYAKKKGYLNAMPLLEVPAMAKRDKEDNRRPHFTRDEMKLLLDYIPIWQDKVRHKLHSYQKGMIWVLIQVMYHSGLRPNEVLQLRWCDVQPLKNTVTLHVAPTTKTGERVAVAMPSIIPVLETLKGFSYHQEADDLLLCDTDGKPLNIPFKPLKELFDGAGVLVDSFGREHTAYSFRHTYATERLLAGVPIDKLAKNLGTSIQYIQAHYDHTNNVMNADVLIRGLN